jgi:fumarate hydratase subunit alpha
MPREIEASAIREAVVGIFSRICFELPADLTNALEAACRNEAKPSARDILDNMLLNAELARTEHIPSCQDTGLAVVFLDLGQDVHVVGGGIQDAVDQGVRTAYEQNYLRKSVVRNALERVNTGDNTPAILHTRIVAGDKIRIVGLAKGAGSENKSALAILPPAEGIEGIKRFVLDTVRKAGGSACPPLIVGIGVGGNFETCAMLAKRALMRELGAQSDNVVAAQLERDLLAGINALGIGPLGFGGKTTALAVHVELAPCHIASLPVAVNINCHADRYGVAEI